MKKFITVLGIFLLVLVCDRISKFVFLDGFNAHFEWISFYLVFNKGVAFSLFAWLGEYVKFLQIGVLVLAAFLLAREKEFSKSNAYFLALIFAGAIGNIIDRFFYPGVIDFIAWHKWFNFAIFNLADVCINIGVALICINEIFFRRKK